MHSNILSINFRLIGFRVFMAIQIVSSIALNIRVIVNYYWVSTEIEHFYMCTGVYMIAIFICLYCKLSRFPGNQIKTSNKNSKCLNHETKQDIAVSP